jgi:hypothetical protein
LHEINYFHSYQRLKKVESHIKGDVLGRKAVLVFVTLLFSAERGRRRRGGGVPAGSHELHVLPIITIHGYYMSSNILLDEHQSSRKS